MAFLQQNISPTQCKDSGLALVLICLILDLATARQAFLAAAIIFLVVAMTAPALYRPFAKLWFGLSHWLGTIVSKIILTLLFYGLVLPVGLVRRLMGKDAMQLRRWKQDQASVLHTRDHLFQPEDLDHPY